MLPIGDDNSGRRIVPFVTYALIAINVLVYFLIELQAQDIEAFLYTWGALPSRVFTAEGIVTSITSMFLHDPFSLLHLGSNMLFLWIFGDNVEDAFGHIPYLLFYLASGIAANVAQALASPAAEVPGVGASGAIAGVLAAYVLLFGNNPIRVLVGFFVMTVPAFLMIGLWIVLQLVNGFGSIGATGGGVAYWAHIGGFFAGLVLALLLRGIDRRTPQVIARRR
jgi:membrane associated rhomboid family serine protease